MTQIINLPGFWLSEVIDPRTPGFIGMPEDNIFRVQYWKDYIEWYDAKGKKLYYENDQWERQKWIYWNWDNLIWWNSSNWDHRYYEWHKKIEYIWWEYFINWQEVQLT